MKSLSDFINESQNIKTTYLINETANDPNGIKGKLSDDNDIANMQKKIGETLLMIINNLKGTYRKYWSIKYGRGRYYGSVILHDDDDTYGSAGGYNTSFMISKDNNDKLLYRIRKTAVGSMGRNLYDNSKHPGGSYSDLNELWEKFTKNQFTFDSSVLKNPKLMDTIKF